MSVGGIIVVSIMVLISLIVGYVIGLAHNAPSSRDE